jgi:hypothetical protein
MIHKEGCSLSLLTHWNALELQLFYKRSNPVEPFLTFMCGIYNCPVQSNVHTKPPHPAPILSTPQPPSHPHLPLTPRKYSARVYRQLPL